MNHSGHRILIHDSRTVSHGRSKGWWLAFRMARMRPFEFRCPLCHMLKELCICETIAACRASIKSRTRIVILMHHRELRRTTNTSRLAQQVLENCEIRIRGLRSSPMPTDGVLGIERHPLLLFPTPDAIELTPKLVAEITKPVTLVVPDGSWGQASKVAKRESFLKEVQRVKLPPGQTSRYALRRGLKQDGLATIEAIAIALGILESPEIQTGLELLLTTMVNRTLRSRGVRPPDERP